MRREPTKPKLALAAALAVVLGSEQAANPVAVRHAWGNSPADLSLQTGDGLPAAPFRTNDR